LPANPGRNNQNVVTGVKDHEHCIDVPVKEILAARMQYYGMSAQERSRGILGEENTGEK
jgi:hypothetical protein